MWDCVDYGWASGESSRVIQIEGLRPGLAVLFLYGWRVFAFPVSADTKLSLHRAGGGGGQSAREGPNGVGRVCEQPFS